MSAPRPGGQGDGVRDVQDLESAVDEFLAVDIDGAEEAELLENVHRLIADALEGK